MMTRCVNKLCEMCEDKVCVSCVCEGKLCEDKLCDDKMCVSKLCDDFYYNLTEPMVSSGI